jgi:Na+/proline symporter
MAEKTYEVGANAFFLPVGTLFGMLILTQIAGRARGYEVFTVPEIIGGRYGETAKMLAVVSLIIAYMVIVSYQFNAGGAVLEVIGGEKKPVTINVGDQIDKRHITKGFIRFIPADSNLAFSSKLTLEAQQGGVWSGKNIELTVKVVPKEEILKEKKAVGDANNLLIIKQGDFAKYGMAKLSDDIVDNKIFRIVSLPEGGQLVRIDPVFTAQKATLIAAVFIILFTMLAGMKSLSSCDIFNGSLIIIGLAIAFPYLLFKAGGIAGMSRAFEAMGDKPDAMNLVGTFTAVDYINFLMPTFLLVMGDANQYQRIFSTKNVRGAKKAAYMLVVIAIVIEVLIIACAWIAASLTPDPAYGRYILIYAARDHMHKVLGLLFMTTAVAIIVSTADAFLLVPATTFIRDVYMKYINPKAKEKNIIIASRFLVIVFGVIAYLVTKTFSETTGFFDKAMYAYTIYGASITPCLVAAMFWKRATKAGAITSILAGTVTTILWGEYIKDIMPSFFAQIDAVLPAITVSVLALFLVSLLTQKRAASNN